VKSPRTLFAFRILNLYPFWHFFYAKWHSSASERIFLKESLFLQKGFVSINWWYWVSAALKNPFSLVLVRSSIWHTVHPKSFSMINLHYDASLRLGVKGNCTWVMSGFFKRLSLLFTIILLKHSHHFNFNSQLHFQMQMMHKCGNR
jgi:hypothetical protein